MSNADPTAIVFEAASLLPDLAPLHRSCLVDDLAKGDIETIREQVEYYRPIAERARILRRTKAEELDRQARALAAKHSHEEIERRLDKLGKDAEHLHLQRAGVVPGRHDLSRKASMSRELDVISNIRALHRRALEVLHDHNA